MVLENYEPKRVLYYFERIAAIPHGSRHTAAISDYLVSFAKEKGLDHRQDSLGNVVIRKPASAGCETAEPVILQGHMDMVCEKEADCDMDMSKEGLRLKVMTRKELPYLMERPLRNGQSGEDVIITAEGTTLGGDDGIAVAYMLAILESDSIPHPALECIFTVDEEIGMLGAAGFDAEDIQGRLLLNIDSEDEGHLLVGCAGGCTTTISLPVERTYPDEIMDTMILSVEGLQGGHSGIEIDKGRANASVLLGRLLQMLFFEFKNDLCLCSVNGGSKDNAIPRSAEAVLLVSQGMQEAVGNYIKEEEAIYRKEYGKREPDLRLVCRFTDEAERPMTRESARNTINLLRCVPNGIQQMSFDIPGLVETSLNLGILTTTEKEISASFSVRSSVNSEKWELINRLSAVAEALGGSCSNEGEYPAWEYREDSRLREVMKSCYEAQYGEPMIVETIHAGVECGLFADKLPGLDAVSFGPDMNDIHTPKEAMDLPSVQRTWKLILSVLKVLGEQ